MARTFDVLEDDYVDFSDPEHVDSWLRSMVNGAGIDALAQTSDEELVNLMKDTPAYEIFLRATDRET